MKLKNLISLIKPGIVIGNLITAVAGFFLGFKHQFNFIAFMGMVIGLTAIVASACVFNNFIDQDIDILMDRTKKRCEAYKNIKPKLWLSFGTLLLLAGSLILLFFTSFYTLSIALFGFVIYVIFYTCWLKRKSHWGTIVGSISGATPPVVGYVAATGYIDKLAIIVFFLLASWQIPHTLSIALYRLKDYTRAKVMLLPVVKGPLYTQYYTLGCLFIFLAMLLLLFVYSALHWAWIVLMITVALYWLACGVKGMIQN